ncbi:hypothetical protein CH330_01360 [candidate division WOR-3 bacterium JGI_Cruoil_03_51_56]|uniref:Glycosyltransferase 2-like domain-containing protein n=1 Tax=candidate division WOR-3 bacterium JGI_Cruoil_03_51_56 TaxID=1973747 RepID=A0A235BXJ6_UNCW3|nr:MAG: hypothetical protein CH330_01360 [candidate division WOR-3 bacterium JGI_Cruoil_03_51_56]
MGKALYYIPSGRNFTLFWQWANRVNFVDKLIVRNYLTHEAHNIARKFFFEHDYDYLIMGHDDYLGSPDHVKMLLGDEEKHHFPVISGWSNIWLPPYKRERPSLASISLRRPNTHKLKTGKLTMNDYGFVAMRDILLAKYGYPFARVWFMGFPLTLIRRDTLKKVPFRPYKKVKDEFCFTAETKKHGRGIVFDLQFALDCEKQHIPIRIDTRIFLLHFGKEGMYSHLRMGRNPRNNWKREIKFIKAKRSF